MRSTTFIQPCPVCGRRLIIERDFAGCEVNCYHCRAVFCSREPEAEKEPEGATATITVDSSNLEGERIHRLEPAPGSPRWNAP